LSVQIYCAFILSCRRTLDGNGRGSKDGKRGDKPRSRLFCFCYTSNYVRDKTDTQISPPVPMAVLHPSSYMTNKLAPTTTAAPARPTLFFHAAPVYGAIVGPEYVGGFTAPVPEGYATPVAVGYWTGTTYIVLISTSTDLLEPAAGATG